MQKAEIQFKKIYEHDMDLLILEEFIADRNFAALFLEKLGLKNEYVVSKAMHSFSDEDGESDLTIVLQYADSRVAVLIEDKIDAPTMKGQSQRYQLRGQKGIDNGEYDGFRVILAAPADYLKEHQNDANAAYEFSITYEELRDYFATQDSARARYKEALISFAVSEKKAGYQVKEVKAVTDFWANLRRYTKERYPALSMVGEDSPKGGAASWPEFRTALGTIKVIYKSPKGYVDLEFPGYGERIGDLRTVIGNQLTAPTPMQIWKTGKAASVRLANERWAVDFRQDFDSVTAVIDEVLQAVTQLCRLAEHLNYSDLY